MLDWSGMDAPPLGSGTGAPPGANGHWLDARVAKVYIVRRTMSTCSLGGPEQGPQNSGYPGVHAPQRSTWPR